MFINDCTGDAAQSPLPRSLERHPQGEKRLLCARGTAETPRHRLSGSHGRAPAGTGLAASPPCSAPEMGTLRPGVTAGHGRSLLISRWAEGQRNRSCIWHSLGDLFIRAGGLRVERARSLSRMRRDGPRNAGQRGVRSGWVLAQFKGWVLLLNSLTGVFPLRHLQRHETCMRFEMKSLFL